MDSRHEQTGRSHDANIVKAGIVARGSDEYQGSSEGGEKQIRRSDKVIQFVECLTNTAGPNAGKPFLLRDWQKEIIRSIYDPANEDGTRQIRTALLTIARKNGKTELIAALCLCHLLGPESELNGQVYSAAADREQAALVFNAAKAMVYADEELTSQLNIIESTKRIVHYGTGSFYKAISSESKTKHGFNASCIIYDELAQAPNRELWDVLTTSTSARAEPLTFVISTMSSCPNSVMTELLDYGRKVNDGVFDDKTFKAFIYEVPLDLDPWDEENWYLANPALGDFRSLEEMRVYAEQAKRIPAKESTFRNLYLNQPVDIAARFISSVEWKACGDEVDEESLKGRPCYAGLDLSSTTDLTSLELYFPEDGGAVLSYFWLPEDGLKEKVKTDKVPYDVWARQGYLNTTPGKAIKKTYVAHKLAEILATYKVKAIAYDRWRIEDFKSILDDEGIKADLEPFGQGYKDMAPAVDALETAILNRQLMHGNHPILTMCAANSVVTLDPAGNRKLNKDKSTGRIDGLVALTMAIGQAVKAEKNGPSIYETRGLRLL